MSLSPANIVASEFHVTVDFNDDFRKAGGSVKPENIDQLMDRFAELGITRVYWIHNAEDFFLPNPLTDAKVDLLARAVEAAHRNGMELYASYKVFETGRSGVALPQNISLPSTKRYIDGVSGHYPIIAPFVLEHPQYRLKRKPDSKQVAGNVTMIKLIKSGSKETRIQKGDLRVLSSSVNGDFKPVEGEFTFLSKVEKRKGREVRVLELSGFNISEKQRYVMVECLLENGIGDFIGPDDSMMELYGEGGKQLASTPDEGKFKREKLEGLLETFYLLQYNKRPPSGAIGSNYGQSSQHLAYYFDAGNSLGRRTLDGQEGSRDGVLVAARGYNSHTIGTMHPVYPEVRKYWIDEIRRRCLDVGVDGVSIRFTNHSGWTSRGAMYGFNQPVVDEYQRRYGVNALTEEIDEKKWRDLQGEYLTLFLTELKQEISQRGKGLQVSINYLMRDTPPGWRKNNVPVNFSYDWEKWISEDIADSVELKYFPFPFSRKKDLGLEHIDRIATLAHKHGKPIYSNVRFESRIPWWEVQADAAAPISADDPRLNSLWEDMRRVCVDSKFDGVILYEGAGFTKMDAATGRTTSAPFVKTMLEQLRSENQESGNK
ncbi:MAG: hypothetical protein GXP30_09950 [Verrucomicrobia bacterium]|nr:hypothetical protein [Verrucomicrobiota bacterium]